MTRHRAPGDTAASHSVMSGGSGRVQGLAVLVRAGIVDVDRPDKSIRGLAALATFGPTLAGGFAAAKARDPDRIAVIDESRQLSYAELDIRVRRIATRLAELGVGADGSAA